MFNEQRLAVENLRFLAKAGGEVEFYDLLRERLLDLAEGWETMRLTVDEREAPAANRRRLLLELESFVPRRGRARLTQEKALQSQGWIVSRRAGEGPQAYDATGLASGGISSVAHSLLQLLSQYPSSFIRLVTETNLQPSGARDYDRAGRPPT